jgi:rfaE bifunctional protein kinase chain/domain
MLGVKSSTKMSSEQIKKRLNKFSKCTIGIVGDLMLDTFTYGKIERMSPEAPAPVVSIENEQQMLGGAGNVAVNTKLLGGEVYIYGKIGEDPEGLKIKNLLSSNNIHLDGVVVDTSNYQTTEKRRVIVSGEHRIRIDREVISDISDEEEELLIQRLTLDIKKFDILVICDYAKGFITESSAKKIQKLAKEFNIPVVVDTKPGRQHWFNNIALMTPNALEINLMTGESNPIIAGSILSKKINSPVLVTQGHEGMSLFHKEVLHHHRPATEICVIDVSGAGDTVVACCSLAIASGADLHECTLIASHAAGIAVSKPGTVAVVYKDLLNKFL